jgi:hypothetical protein
MSPIMLRSRSEEPRRWTAGALLLGGSHRLCCSGACGLPVFDLVVPPCDPTGAQLYPIGKLAGFLQACGVREGIGDIRVGEQHERSSE